MTKAIELLKRASELLQDYCSDFNGDMNCSLSTEIDEFVKNDLWLTDFENIPNDYGVYEEYDYVFYTIPVIVTIRTKSGKLIVDKAYSYQFKPDSDGAEYLIRWAYADSNARYINGEVLAYQLLPEPYKGN
jgi:hypothetical protein